MSSTTPATRTIDQLCVSPLNVRTVRPEAEDDAELEASILAEGLLNPIVVHPLAGDPPRWGAVAGGRRYRAIAALVARGDLSPDWPVRVVIHEGLADAELIELSIAENLIRRDLRDHELFAAVARARAEGHDAETIARRLGQDDVDRVRRWARLGELAPPVFAAFVAGRLDIGHAKAFAATADTALQAAVFARLEAEGGYIDTRRIHAALKVGDREQARMLTFVGEAVYRAAGGSFELDLFSDIEADRGRVTDPDLLARLVEEKMASVRDQVRATCQRRELRFVAAPPAAEWGGPDHHLQIQPRRNAAGMPILPDGAGVVAHVGIDAAGEPVVSWWWESRKAKYGSEKPAAAAPVSAGPIGGAISPCGAGKQQADAAIRAEAGATQEMVQVLRAQRKAILRALLLDDAEAGGEVATDHLVWAQLRLAVRVPAERPASTGMRAIASDSSVGVGSAALDRMRAAVAAMPAARAIAAALQELSREPFLAGDDPAAAFLAYRDAPARTKRIAAAIVAGLALERSLAADGYRIAVHDAVAHDCADRSGGDPVAPESLRRHWSPTADLLADLPKAQLIEIARPFVTAGTLAAWGRLKADALADAVLDLVTGAPASAARPDARAAAAAWLHPLLVFDPPPGSAADDDETEWKEAAE